MHNTNLNSNLTATSHNSCRGHRAEKKQKYAYYKYCHIVTDTVLLLHALVISKVKWTAAVLCWLVHLQFY